MPHVGELLQQHAPLTYTPTAPCHNLDAPLPRHASYLRAPLLQSDSFRVHPYRRMHQFGAPDRHIGY